MFLLACPAYEARLYYYGDYAADREADRLDPAAFSASVKAKGKALILKAAKDSVYVQDPELESVAPAYAESLAARLIEAGNAAAALSEAIRSYMYPGNGPEEGNPE